MTRRAARPGAGRSAPAEGRSRGRMTSSGEHAIVAPMENDALERARERLCRSGRREGPAGRRRSGPRPGAGPGRGARCDRSRARVDAPRPGRRGGPGRHPAGGSPRLAPARRGARAGEPDDPSARANRGRAPRRAQLARRRPRPAGRPRRVELAGGRRAAAPDRGSSCTTAAARPSTASAKPASEIATRSAPG